MKFFSGSKTWFQVAILQEPNNIMNQCYVVIFFEALKNGLKKMQTNTLLFRICLYG